MNANAVNLNSSHAVQSQNPAGKQVDSAAAETPFSQVLSSEIAQSRKGDEARQDAQAEAGKEAASQADASAESGEVSRAHAPESGELARNPQGAVPEKEAAPMPEALLGLATLPATMHPASLLSFQNMPKGGAALGTQSGPLANSGCGSQKIDPALVGKAAVQASRAAALPSQLAASRQADMQKTGELLPELMNNPAMRPATHALLETLPTPGEIASPRLTPTVGTAAWGQALGEKIVWMASSTQQTATLTLNPPNLGPLQVVLNVSNEQATASFFSAQPEVRQALESAFPRLREMMNDAGIQLGQATVSADTPQQFNDSSDRQAQRAAAPFSGEDEAVAAGLQAVHAPVQRSGRGLVDTFA